MNRYVEIGSFVDFGLVDEGKHYFSELNLIKVIVRNLFWSIDTLQ